MKLITLFLSFILFSKISPGLCDTIVCDVCCKISDGLPVCIEESITCEVKANNDW